MYGDQGLGPKEGGVGGGGRSAEGGGGERERLCQCVQCNVNMFQPCHRGCTMYRLHRRANGPVYM